MENVLTNAQVSEGIDVRWLPFFVIQPASISVEALPYLREIWDLINFLAPKLKLDKPAYIFIGMAPFNVSLTTGLLSYSPISEAIHTYVENMIFIDLSQLVKLNPLNRRITVLEELVHVYMRVTDECLVKQVVSALCPGVRCEGERYLTT